MIHVAHIGGRGKVPEPFAAFSEEFSYDIFDADRAACIDDFSHVVGRRVLHNCGVSKADSTRILYVNTGPTGSSLFPSGHDAESEWFHELGRTDYLFSRVQRPVSTEIIDVRSIDSLVHDASMFSPHWLRIDAEGSELEVLEGAKQAIRTSCVACTIEVTLIAKYNNGATLTKVHDFMDQNHFWIAEIEPILGSPFHHPSGQRGKQIPFACDVIYLRDPRDLSSEENLKASALIATCLGFSEIGISALNLLVDHYSPDCIESSDSEVDKFLWQMYQLVSRQYAFPALWDDIAITSRNFAVLPNTSQSTECTGASGGNDALESRAEFDFGLLVSDSEAFECFLRSWCLESAADSVAERRAQFLSHIWVSDWEGA